MAKVMIGKNLLSDLPDKERVLIVLLIAARDIYGRMQKYSLRNDIFYVLKTAASDAASHMNIRTGTWLLSTFANGAGSM